MTGVVDDAEAAVDGRGRRGEGRLAGAVVGSGHRGEPAVRDQLVVLDDVLVLDVALAIIARPGALVGGHGQSLLHPALGTVLLVCDGLVHLGRHLRRALRAEAAHDQVQVVVTAGHQAQGRIGGAGFAAARGGVALDVGPVAHQLDIEQAGVGIVGVLDGGPDIGSGGHLLGVHREAHVPLVLDVGLDGLGIPGGVDDEQFAGIPQFVRPGGTAGSQGRFARGGRSGIQEHPLQGAEDFRSHLAAFGAEIPNGHGTAGGLHPEHQPLVDLGGLGAVVHLGHGKTQVVAGDVADQEAFAMLKGIRGVGARLQALLADHVGNAGRILVAQDLAAAGQVGVADGEGADFGIHQLRGVFLVGVHHQVGLLAEDFRVALLPAFQQAGNLEPAVHLALAHHAPQGGLARQLEGDEDGTVRLIGSREGVAHFPVAADHIGAIAHGAGSCEGGTRGEDEREACEGALQGGTRIHDRLHQRGRHEHAQQPLVENRLARHLHRRGQSRGERAILNRSSRDRV
ncbi:MAG: hypothetical protein BWY56_01761 [Acidobacteria bacterium ADurb.Bin340]|nr:MAG: hypothetical protein BWY56_01761 [Acidobacteria bacterium ADurb.Bin340]